MDIGKELNLPEKWFNSNVQMRRDCLPDDWKSRRQPVFSGMRLVVYAISRVDLIAMKFIAHRKQDLVDLAALHVRADDITFVREYLGQLPAKGTGLEQISETVEILGSWPVSR